MSCGGGGGGAVRMEADSTTCGRAPAGGAGAAEGGGDAAAALARHPRNAQFYRTNIDSISQPGQHVPLVQWLRESKLITSEMPCDKCQQLMSVRQSRVQDKMHWFCDKCQHTGPLRANSFFLNIFCSLPNTLKIILAWCEDMDHVLAAKVVDVKVRETNAVYNRLDSIAASEGRKLRLGGDRSAVVVELYPACLEHRSPDSSEQRKHQHHILMLHDTKHAPTRLHVMTSKINKTDNNLISGKKSKTDNGEIVKKEPWHEEILRFCSEVCEPDSDLITGLAVPELTSAKFRSVTSLHRLLEYSNEDMRHFLSTRIWKQAVTLCSAAHDICSMTTNPRHPCSTAVQKYLDAAVFRLSCDADGFYEHMLNVVANHYAR